MSLSEYYKQLEARKIDDAQPAAVSSGMYSDQTAGKAPVQSMMYLGQEERKLAKDMDSLGSLRNRAMNGLTGALDELVQKFGEDKTTVFTVKLAPDMMDERGHLKLDGMSHEKFGAKEIERDAQLDRLTQDVERAKSYFPDAKLHEIESADGKRVAIVTGADAREFNAVIAAEREWDTLQQQQMLLKQEKDRVNQKMGIASAPISGGKEADSVRFAHGPAPIKARETELS